MKLRFAFDYHDKKLVGDRNGADLEIEVWDEDGEKQYNIRCLCGACQQVEQVGADAYDPDNTMEVDTVYYMKAWYETITIPMVGTEYDCGLAINEGEPDA